MIADLHACVEKHDVAAAIKRPTPFEKPPPDVGRAGGIRGRP